MTMSPLETIAYAKTARIDPPRIDTRTGEERPRVKARVVCDTLGQTACGQMLVMGENVVELYAEDVETNLMAMLETWLLEPIIVSRKEVKQKTVFDFDKGLASNVEVHEHVLQSVDERELKGEEREAAIARNKLAVDREFERAVADYTMSGDTGNPNHYRRPYMPSRSAAFHEVFRRDQRPFSAVEILGEVSVAVPSKRSR